MNHKSSLRQHFLQKRKALDKVIKQKWDAQIQSHLLELCHRLQINSLGVYSPIQAEPDLRSCFATLHHQGIQLALPVVEEKNAPLRFVCWKPGDAMQKDVFGIDMPLNLTAALQPQALLMPCVGWDTKGYRLGYGGGFYDRTLSDYEKNQHSCWRIGIAYHESLCEFESQAWDIPMHYVITEQSVTQFK